MHIEVLVEDRSGATLVETLMPRVICESHTWRVISYKGIGRIPKGMTGNSDPAKRALLDQLPRVLKGYGKTPYVDAVVVVVDSDHRDCKEFLAELKALTEQCHPAPKTLFRLAIEEMEAWLLGDRKALQAAYPKAKMSTLAKYHQDSICNTWELLADAVYPGGYKAIRDAGYPECGRLKHEWAEKIARHMDVENNASHSFCKFRDGVRGLFSAGA